jgi:flagellar biosynthetic protein FliO
VFFDMVLSRNKKVIFLIAVMLGCGVILVCSSQSAADAEKPTSNSGGKELENSQSQSNSLFGNDPNLVTNSNNGPGVRALFFKFMVSVLFIVALGAAGIYVSKRFLPKITNLSGKEIRIAETVHLGPRKAVHLLEIGERRFLIGSTNENITRLADLTSTLAELPVREIDNN